MFPFLVFIAALMVVQIFLAMKQFFGLKTFYKEILKRNHMVTIGRTRGFGRNRIAMLAFTEDGILTEGYLLAGMTVFARFKKIDSIDGENYIDLMKKYEDDRHGKCILQALGFVREHMEAEGRVEGDHQPLQA